MRLRGTTIDGDLDLRGATLGVRLALIECTVLVPVFDLGQKSSWHYRNEARQLFSDFPQVAGWILATAALGLVGRVAERESTGASAPLTFSAGRWAA